MSERAPGKTPGASQDTWRRWQMESFQTAPAGDPADSPETSARLQELEKQAQQRGHALGYADGHAEGLAAGTAAGTQEGHQNGYKQGHAEGYEAGYAQGQAKARHEAEALQAMAASFAATLGSLEEDIGQGLVALAIGIAEQIMRDTVATRPESLLPVIGEIVQLHGDSDAALVIHAHPDDCDLLKKYLDNDAIVKRWRLVPDTDIEQGGCTAHTALGAVDGTLATRWRRAVTALGHPAALPPPPSC